MRVAGSLTPVLTVEILEMVERWCYYLQRWEKLPFEGWMEAWIPMHEYNPKGGRAAWRRHEYQSQELFVVT